MYLNTDENQGLPFRCILTLLQGMQVSLSERKISVKFPQDWSVVNVIFTLAFQSSVAAPKEKGIMGSSARQTSLCDCLIHYLDE